MNTETLSFPGEFDEFLVPDCQGDHLGQGNSLRLEVEGFQVEARVHQDDGAMGPPWEEHDGHGSVSDWTTRDKLPGERVLSSDDSYNRYYDWAGAIQKAKEEGWNAYPYSVEGETKGQQAEMAVAHDFEYLKAWCNNEWFWAGVVLSVRYNGVMLDDHAASCWGIECNASSKDPAYRPNAYIKELADELLPEALEAGRKALAELRAKLA